MCDKIVVSEALMFRNGALMVYISKNKGIIDFWDDLEIDLEQILAKIEFSELEGVGWKLKSIKIVFFLNWDFLGLDYFIKYLEVAQKRFRVDKFPCSMTLSACPVGHDSNFELFLSILAISSV